MDSAIFKTPPTSPRNGTPEVTRSQSKRTAVSSPSRPLSPREIPLPISPIPGSPYPQTLSASSSFTSSQRSTARVSNENRGFGLPDKSQSPPARPPRPPTSLPNIRPTIILSPSLVPSLPPADRPLYLKGKTSFSTASTSPGQPTFSIATNSTWEEHSYSALTPPSPCFINSPPCTESHAFPKAASPFSPSYSQRRPSLPNPPKSPRKPHRHHNSIVHVNSHRRGHSSSSGSAGTYPSTNASACGSVTASATSSPSSSLIRLSSPHPPSPSPYPPPTSPLPAPPSPSPLPRVRSHNEIQPRIPRTRQNTVQATHYSSSHEGYGHGHGHGHDEDDITPLKVENAACTSTNPSYKSLQYHSHHREYYRPSAPHSNDCPPAELPAHYNDDEEAGHRGSGAGVGISKLPSRWKSKDRKHLWMLLTAATVALLVGAILGGVLWRLSHR